MNIDAVMPNLRITCSPVCTSEPSHKAVITDKYWVPYFLGHPVLCASQMLVSSPSWVMIQAWMVAWSRST